MCACTTFYVKLDTAVNCRMGSDRIPLPFRVVKVVLKGDKICYLSVHFQKKKKREKTVFAILYHYHAAISIINSNNIEQSNMSP